MKISLYIVIVAFFLNGCVNTPRHFMSAGFSSVDEPKKYISDYLYYANKLTDEEWDAFYQRFPEYWKDLQNAKLFGSTMEYHPWYTAYSFKWNSDKKKLKWSEVLLKRLKEKKLLVGDDVFKVLYARGVPDRVVWDNDFEILIFKADNALIFKNSVFNKESECVGCSRNYDGVYEQGMTEDGILKVLNLSRPKY